MSDGLQNSPCRISAKPFLKSIASATQQFSKY